ncbi:bacterial type II secretion system domain protein F [Enterococcus casseliflavus ATCC 12755]|uniref:Bacterial type II secretion system domain protein F n=1 Tax=Enterococcus casseliflavus ATCC 12755 TaxID=888066 RepID=F0EKM3_ENTCA|nr:type II secretion system F family protein [Enterococcus casseliflavus]EGC69314.1 bacterial type II secretion system domain protein F [Enterococcus casseliflavus ATCC 12755]
MALFAYQGTNVRGETFSGSLRANSSVEARQKLRQKHIKVNSLIEQPETLANKEIQLFNKVSLKLLVAYLRQFSTLIASGITIVDASRMLEEQQKKPNFKRILGEVRDDIDGGRPLSEAYKAHPNAFPVLLTSVITVSEMSGSLEKNLTDMADYYEKSAENRSGLVTAMVYPIILILMTFVVGIILLVMIVPMFVEVFESFDTDLPRITVITMAISDFLQTRGWVLAVFIVGIMIGFWLIRRNEKIDFAVHRFILKIPLFGELAIKNNYSLFMTTLSTLLGSSVGMVTALNMSRDVVSNKSIKRIIDNCAFQIEEGGKMSDVFRGNINVPLLVTQMVEIGESTGSLEDMLKRLSIIFQKEVDESSKRIKTVLEPTVILVICVIVGLIVAAIMVPMFDLFGAIQG